MDVLDYGKRAASERDYVKTLNGDALGEMNPRPNPVFDESDDLLLYPTMFGILVRSVHTVP